MPPQQGICLLPPFHLQTPGPQARLPAAAVQVTGLPLTVPTSAPLCPPHSSRHTEAGDLRGPQP